MRRLSPNNRKIEAEKGGVSLLTPDLLQAMGLELANVHLGTANRGDAIVRDLKAAQGATGSSPMPSKPPPPSRATSRTGRRA